MPQPLTIAGLFSHQRIAVQVVHTHECPVWRIGKKHGPCNCGGAALEAEIEQLKAKALQPSPGVICAAWTRLSDGTIARCDRAHRHEGDHLDGVIAIGWQQGKGDSDRVACGALGHVELKHWGPDDDYLTVTAQVPMEKFKPGDQVAVRVELRERRG